MSASEENTGPNLASAPPITDLPDSAAVNEQKSEESTSNMLVDDPENKVMVAKIKTEPLDEMPEPPIIIKQEPIEEEEAMDQDMTAVDSKTFVPDPEQRCHIKKETVIVTNENEHELDPQGFLSNLYGIFCGTHCSKAKEDIEWFGPFSMLAFFTENKYTTLRSAVTFLLAFVQENFTGPMRFEGYEEFTNKHPLNLIKQMMRVDGEEINVNVRHLELFYSSKTLMDRLSKSFPKCIVIKWWKMRLIVIHQKILDELAGSLYNEFKSLAESLITERTNLNNKELEVLLSIEISQGYLLFHRVQKSEECLNNISETYKIDLVIEGLLGLRTKFQEKPVSILCLKVDGVANLEINADESRKSKIKLPMLIKHEDDTRLEKIKFINEKDNDVIQMPDAIQAFVLAKLNHILKSQPKDRLAGEEVEPYINSLLYQENGPLTIRLVTLLLNVEQESSSQRTIDRCMKQLEDISTIIKNKGRYTLKERMQNFFHSNLPPLWEIRRTYGDIMVSLGLIKGALDIYIEVQSWENVIDCYNQLELKHKAAEVIQQELEKQPTVKLYCLLGDATDNPKCYKKAWKLSQETSSLAQRHWGNYYFAKKDYKAALRHLAKTLEINSLQEVQWLRLGFAAITLEKWKLAVKAYITYTHLEPNGFESWNNLAKALIKLGDKPRAHKVLQESLKCNFDNWKVWENFMAVSVDTGNFEDAIHSYERLNELKSNFLDYEVLEIITRAITTDKPDAKGRPSSRLKKNAVKLIGYQCVKHAMNWKVWKLAANLSDNSLHMSQKLQKSFRAYIDNQKSWTLQKETTLECLTLCLELCEKSLASITDHNEDEKSSVNSQLSSARLSAQSCITLVEKSDEKFEEAIEMLKKLQELHGKLTEELKQRM